jgi:tight adherence protein C
VADHRSAHIEARLQEFPKTPLKSGANAQRVNLAVNERMRSPTELIDSSGTISTSEQDGQGRQSWLSQSLLAGPFATSPALAVNLTCMIVPVLLGLLAAHLGFIERRAGLMWGSLAGLGAVALPSAWVRHKIAAQHAALRHALPDFLDLMIVCLESGLSVQGTILRVGEEIRIAHPRLGDELRVVQRDIELGATVDAAFRNFAHRSGLDAVRTLSSFIREAQRFGSQLSDALRAHAEMLRYQREQAAEENAQKASIKMLFPTLLLILPAVFVVLVGPAAIKIQEAFSK